MGGTSVSTSQMAMIAYLLVIRRERFFAHVTVCGAVKFFIVEIYMGTLAARIQFTLCAKSLSCLINHTMQSLLRRNRYMNYESS